jgi:hypothetical protein
VRSGALCALRPAAGHRPTIRDLIHGISVAIIALQNALK